MKRTFRYFKNSQGRGAFISFEYEIKEETFKKYHGYWKVFPRGIIYFVPWIKRVVYASRNCEDIKKIISDMKELTKDWEEKERLNFILKFCRSPDYETDRKLYGIFDYWATAQETLYLNRGDCEDLSILLNTFLIEFGYDSKFIMMKDHMACGIAGDFSGEYLESNGKKYYYVESVNDRPIGSISDTNKAKKKVIINSH